MPPWQLERLRNALRYVSNEWAFVTKERATDGIYPGSEEAALYAADVRALLQYHDDRLAMETEFPERGTSAA